MDYQDRWTLNEIQQIIETEITGTSLREYFEEVCKDVINDMQLSKNITNETGEKSEKITSLPLQIALLHEIGFFELEKIKNLNKDQREKIISILLNRTDTRGIRGNINVLNDQSKEDALKYTSHKKTNDAKEILKNL